MEIVLLLFLLLLMFFDGGGEGGGTIPNRMHVYSHPIDLKS